jgi:hypothetical protein
VHVSECSSFCWCVVVLSSLSSVLPLFSESSLCFLVFSVFLEWGFSLLLLAFFFFVCVCLLEGRDWQQRRKDRQKKYAKRQYNRAKKERGISCTASCFLHSNFSFLCYSRGTERVVSRFFFKCLIPLHLTLSCLKKQQQ